jgi:hypothetical protein
VVASTEDQYAKAAIRFFDEATIKREEHAQITQFGTLARLDSNKSGIFHQLIISDQE